MTWRLMGLMASMVVTLPSVGCKPGDDENAPALAPQKVAFEGTIDPKFAGDWKSVDGSSELVLAKDGSLKITSVSFSMKGKSSNNVGGKWRASSDGLVFQYGSDASAPRVVAYKPELAGNTLTLSQAKGRLKTIYKRK